MSFIDLCISDFNIVEFISLWTLQKVTDFPSAEDTGLSEDATKQANKAVAAELQKHSVKSITGTARKRKNPYLAFTDGAESYYQKICGY